MPTLSWEPGPSFARALDREDPLAGFRRRFERPRQRPGKPLVYLCGHSLGLMPRRARGLIERELRRWSAEAVEGHTRSADGWLDYHERFRQPLATLLGAKPIEVVAMNTLTVNLHLMLVSFFRPTKTRYKILIERDAFPSDRYAVDSQLRFHGLDPERALVELAPKPGSMRLDIERLQQILERDGERIALLLLPGVQFLSGQALDVAALTRLAHRFGCTIGFDLAHAIGNVPLELDAAGPDFAVWCSYKYLNAGPGAVAGCFVHERWAEAGLPRFAGWWGHDRASRFSMPSRFAAARGADGWQLSNPPIFSLTPLEASLALFDAAGMPALRQKSTQLTAYLQHLLETELGADVEILTPASRGCQLSVRLTSPAHRADGVAKRLRGAGVVVDWRPPDVLRLAPVPLYNGFRDVFDAVAGLRAALR